MVVVVVIVVIILSARSPKTTPGTNGPIKIGAVLGLTGYASVDSLNVKRGVDLAVADLAAKGVVVDVSYQDDKTDPKETVSAIQYLVANDKPQAIIGPIWSFLEDAGAPVLTQAKLVAFAPANTSEFTTGGPYIFHGAVKNEKIIQPIADWLRAKNIQRVAIIVSKDAWGLSVDSRFQAAAAAASSSIVLDDQILSQQDTASVTSSDITKAKSLKAQAILYTGYDEGATILAKKRTQLGFQVPTLVHGQFYGPLIDRGAVTKDEVKGTDVLEVPPSPDFVAKFKAQYGQVPGIYADRAYDGVMFLVDAIQHAPSTDGDALAEYIRTQTHYQGYAGLYEFDAKGDLQGGSWTIDPVLK